MRYDAVYAFFYIIINCFHMYCAKLFLVYHEQKNKIMQHVRLEPTEHLKYFVQQVPLEHTLLQKIV